MKNYDMNKKMQQSDSKLLNVSKQTRNVSHACKTQHNNRKFDEQHDEGLSRSSALIVQR